MPPTARSTPGVRWLLVAGVVLLGCPQLLDDGFSLASQAVETGGTGLCSTPECPSTDGDVVGGMAGSGGAAGNGGTAGNAGAAGGSGTAGSAADGGEGGDGGSAVVTLLDGDAGTTADAGVTPLDDEPDATPVGPSCRIITLNDSTHSASDNCVGVYGWNAIQNGTGSTLSRTYQNGDVCFSGSISSSGYGAVYNLTLSNEDDWNANSYGTTGFEFDFSGPVLPASLKILYTSNGDYCRPVTPAGTVSVPFTETHPCGGGPGTPDITQLTILQLNFGAGNYAVNFCVQIRALP